MLLSIPMTSIENYVWHISPIFFLFNCLLLLICRHFLYILDSNCERGAYNCQISTLVNDLSLHLFVLPIIYRSLKFFSILKSVSIFLYALYDEKSYIFSVWFCKSMFLSFLQKVLQLYFFPMKFLICLEFVFLYGVMYWSNFIFAFFFFFLVLVQFSN